MTKTFSFEEIEAGAKLLFEHAVSRGIASGTWNEQHSAGKEFYFISAKQALESSAQFDVHYTVETIERAKAVFKVQDTDVCPALGWTALPWELIDPMVKNYYVKLVDWHNRGMVKILPDQ